MIVFDSSEREIRHHFGAYSDISNQADLIITSGEMFAEQLTHVIKNFGMGNLAKINTNNIPVKLYCISSNKTIKIDLPDAD